MSVPALIPLPRLVEWGDGALQFAGPVRVVAPGEGPPELGLVMDALGRALQEQGGMEIQRTDGFDAGDAISGAIVLRVQQLPEKFGDEGYRLTIEDGVLIEAASPRGLFYGVQTLRQILTQDGGRLLARRCMVEDWPQWPWRGVLLDQGRNYMSLPFLKEQIDVMSRYKMSVFHFHPTEYPGWRVEIKAFPQLRSELCYSQEELRELVGYARERFVTVVPEIDMPGHSTAFLDLMPHLQCTNLTMCMGSEEVYEALEQILTEVADIFPSEIIHIGTDECAGGEDCPRCQAKWAEISGQSDEPPKLMGYFIERISGIVKGLGRRAMIWNDQLEAGIPKDILIHSWSWDSDTKGILEAGYQVVDAHSRHVYFDHGQAPERVELIYNWSPNQDAPADHPNLLGGQGQAWHDPPADEQQILEDLGFYPRLLTVAERVWLGPEGRDIPFEKYRERLLRHKERFFEGMPFPYPEQTENWHERYEGWTCPRGIWTAPDDA